MILRRILKECRNQIQRHPKTISYVFNSFKLSANNPLLKHQRYIHRMTPLHHETDHEVLSRPDTITVTFVNKDGERTEVKGREGERALYLAHRKGSSISKSFFNLSLNPCSHKGSQIVLDKGMVLSGYCVGLKL